MKNITAFYLKKHINSAAGSVAPDDADAIWEQPVERATGSEWFLDGIDKSKKRTKTVIKTVSALAACLAVALLSVFILNSRPDATVYLDVNPSIEMQINRYEKVISASASNHDGEVILEDMDLKNSDLNVAINALLGSMVKHGYISEAQNMILLSVDSRDPEKALALRDRLTDEINRCMLSLVGSSSVIEQNMHTDDELEDLAEKYGITPGKAYLIQRLIMADPELSFEELAGLSMNDLVIRLRQKGIDIRDFAKYTVKDIDDPDDLFDDDDDIIISSEQVTTPPSGGNNPGQEIKSSRDYDDDDDDDNDDDDGDDVYDTDADDDEYDD
jgi:hypothetical protein